MQRLKRATMPNWFAQAWLSPHLGQKFDKMFFVNSKGKCILQPYMKEREGYGRLDPNRPFITLPNGMRIPVFIYAVPHWEAKL